MAKVKTLKNTKVVEVSVEELFKLFTPMKDDEQCNGANITFKDSCGLTITCYGIHKKGTNFKDNEFEEIGNKVRK